MSPKKATVELNADELGEKGQAHFRVICADAKLISNESNRDRTGWDYLVEFPLTPLSTDKISLETRPVPISCHVQVKTLLEKSDRVQERLTSMERLAKELKPAFIYAFKVNGANEFVGAYLIHLLDAPLAKVLRRLRSEDINGVEAPNKKFISMSARGDGIAVAPTGVALREAISQCVGSDLHDYAARKAKQIATLGIDEHPYELKMSLHVESADDLVDAFLGLKTNISASDLSATHSRFGLRKAVPELMNGTAKISIEPSPVAKCLITMRDGSLGIPDIFEGQVFFPAIPKLQKEQFKVLFKTNLFSVVFFAGGWRVWAHTDAGPRTPAAWSAYWRFARMLAKGEGSLQITVASRDFDATIPVNKRVAELDLSYCEFWAALCNDVSELLKYAGVHDEPTLSMEEIYSNALLIHLLHRMLHPEDGAAPISFESPLPETLPSTPLDHEMIYANCLQLGDVALGFYGLARLVGKVAHGAITWTSPNVELKKLLVLRSLPQDYEKLIQTARHETGCVNLIALELRDGSGQGV